jgi:hypothetical protein
VSTDPLRTRRSSHWAIAALLTATLLQAGCGVLLLAGGDPVDIRLIAKDDDQTDLRIRIGVFGNEARSRLVLEQIRQAL